MAPPAGTPGAAEAEKEFELQAPPEGKRPRTPNELDHPVEDAPVEAAVEEEKSAEESAAPVADEAEAAEPSQDAAPTTPAAGSGMFL